MSASATVSPPATSLFIVVRLGAQRFAVDAASVDRTLRMVAITPTPDVAGAVAGVLNLRGRTAPVVDPRPRLGIGTSAPDPTHVLVVSRSTRPFLVWVDAVEGTLEAGEAEVETVSVGGERSRLTPALVRRPQGVLPLLSLDALDPVAVIESAVPSVPGVPR